MGETHPFRGVDACSRRNEKERATANRNKGLKKVGARSEHYCLGLVVCFKDPETGQPDRIEAKGGRKKQIWRGENESQLKVANTPKVYACSKSVYDGIGTQKCLVYSAGRGKRTKEVISHHAKEGKSLARRGR